MGGGRRRGQEEGDEGEGGGGRRGQGTRMRAGLNLPETGRLMTCLLL